MSHYIVPKNFDIFVAEQFVESLTEPANNLLYMFYGNHLPFENDNNPPKPLNSISGTFHDVYDNMIGGKKVRAQDLAHVVPKYIWESGTIYDEYDNKTENLFTKKFYVAVKEGSYYNVFKCLDNNKRSRSTQSPLKSEFVQGDEIYTTVTDGYQWKYMYSVSEATWDQFTTEDFMPVVANSAVSSSAIDGAIYKISIDSAGQDYSSYAEGFITDTNIGGDDKVIEVSGTTSLVLTTVNASNTFTKEEITTSFLEAILISDGGLGFSNTDTINITGGSPTVPATATLSTNSTGGITGINLTNKGKSYQETPTITVTSSTNTAAAILTGRIKSSTAIVSNVDGNTITITSVEGSITEADEITGAQSNAVANISNVVRVGDLLSPNSDFYKGSTLYIDHGTDAGQFATIDDYIVTSQAKRIILNTSFATPLADDSHFIISPKVEIVGDGTGAAALARVNKVLNANNIANVQMLSIGSGYTYADISITGNSGFVTNASSNSYLQTSANARAILSPCDGHGFDAKRELFANRVGISVTFANTGGGVISANNDYRQVGIIRDPKFANGVLTISSSDTAAISGETITGTNSLATAYVYSASATELLVSNIVGYFETSENITGSAGANVVISTVDQPTTYFRQTYKYTGEVTTAQGLEEDELITQGESQSNAKVLIPLESGTGTFEVTNQRNTFLLSDSATNTDKYINGQTSEAQVKLTSTSLPQVVDGTGEVLYLENFTPVSRDNNQSETFRIIIEF
jgi:hypothetical protein